MRHSDLFELATLKDLPQIISICYRVYKEVADGGLPEPVLEDIAEMVGSKIENNLVFVHKDKQQHRGKILAIGILSIDAPWWNRQKISLVTTLLFVDPSKRSERLGIKLLKFLQDYAILNCGVDLYVDLVSVHGEADLKRKQRLLDFLKMTPVGVLYKS